jgi:hypothetical protein
MNALSFGMLLTAGAAGADPVPPVLPYPTAPYALAGPNSGNIYPGLPPAGPVSLPYMPGSDAQPGVPLPGTYPPGIAPPQAPAAVQQTLSDIGSAPVRRLFQSDHEFDNFIGPMSNPFFAKDPRSNTYFRFVFLDNWMPNGQALGNNFQTYTLQHDLAITERLNLIIDKNGFGNFNGHNGATNGGFLNSTVGLKYTFYRNVETQTIAAAGLQYEIPWGDKEVLQGFGSGALNPFVTLGQQFRQKWHYLQTTGVYVPLTPSQGSTFIYNSFHLDRQCWGWLYPLAELNWYWYTSSGTQFPNAVGQGDGIFNLGTMGVANHHQFTAAVGFKAVLTKYLQVGVAYEYPLTSPQYLLDQRLLVDVILRY